MRAGRGAAELGGTGRLADHAGGDPAAGEQPKERIGSLFFNFGGPGVSGVDTVKATGRQLDKIGDGRFDVISWDPRGVGASTHISCFASKREEARFWGVYTVPVTKAEWTRVVAGADHEDLVRGRRVPRAGVAVHSPGSSGRPARPGRSPLTHEGYGHTSDVDPSACVERDVAKYLITLATPPNGAVCQSDRQPFDPKFGEPVK